ncbi:hypothetical protein BT67DRAFT_98442 [Trichocladium antarcticum]|uniref:ADF-H domain-containing protein n=1 Tax=Trichocladium antarcticum TaxID=1450529 RepID=A0AAN6ZFH0_9PEZI|nr:hypothetical protein BT67DRAFT_98442 [Trichocladium antarcticum]
MSLNGLDDARVKEAHDVAVAEPGGWFLLKYASRDEVELLGRGNGGIVEIRNNIAQYEDKSPLYGFLRYRRRNVIIKYLPEGCSRLIQARVAVHFDAVCDRFSPHDTTFSITESKELKDTKLSAACSLHTASDSMSSSTSSLRRRRLMEIAEEEEEEERERKRQSIGKEDEGWKPPAGPLSETPVRLDADLAHSPDASRFANDLDPPQFIGVPRPSSPTKSFDESSRRLSSQTSRSDIYPTTSYPYLKPRVKLGPRPSADTGGRPRSSAGGAPHRPVSTVPAGLKSFHKGSKKGRSSSQDQDEEVPESPIKEEAEAENTFLPVLPIAEADPGAKPTDSELAQPQIGNDDEILTTSTSAPQTNMAANKLNTMTPEKARLLKAMKLREKKKMLSLQPTLDVPAADIPSAPSTPGLPDENQDFGTPENDLPAVSKADSGIEIDVGTDHASVDTRTDSHPPSPVAASDIDDSTRASSLSDSTDETVLAKDEDVKLDNGLNDSEALPTKRNIAGPDLESPDGQPKTPISVAQEPGGDNEPRAAIEDKTRQNEAAISDVPAEEGLVTRPVSTPAAVPLPPSPPEQDESRTTPPETVTQPEPASDTAQTAATDIAEEERPPSPQVRIPVSKFATQETKSPTGAASQDIPSRRKLPEPIQTNLNGPENGKRRSVISITENDGFMDELQSATVQQATPITVSKSPISPFFSVDAGSKRPPGGPGNSVVASRFSRTVSNPVRNSFLAPELSTAPARSVSSGASYLQRLSQQQAAADARPKSSKLGSSISQRIKALEQLSGTPGGAGAAAGKDRPSSTFFAVRKASTREPSRPSSVASRAGSMRGRSPSPPPTRDSSPETSRTVKRDRSGSLVNRLSMFEGGMTPRGRPESVQVTARIVREPNQAFPKASDSNAPLRLKQSPLVVDVQNRVPSQSPARPPSSLSMRRQEQMLTQNKHALFERRQSQEYSSQSRGRDMEGPEVTHQVPEGLRPRRRSSLSVVKDFIKDRTDSLKGAMSPSTDNLVLPPAPEGLVSPSNPASRSPSRAPSVHQAGSLARRLSISSRRSSMEQNTPAVPTTTTSTILTAARAADAGAEPESDAKSITSSGPASPNQSKASRTSRFMRRLSSTLVAGRTKNGAPSISPTVAEEDAAEVEAASKGSTAAGAATQSQPTIVAFMGDVNVQFPDNLLWKRRSICLDSQGFLILSAVSGSPMLPTAIPGKDGKHGALLKRYHMSDFRPPYAPDVELQELPNSVVLDLVAGSGLQIACEDRAGQMSILHILEEAHQSHTSFGR